jgi:ribosomal protein S13
MNDELKYRIAFASIRGMGMDLARKILEVIPSEKEFFMLSERELKSVTQSRSRVTERAYRQAVPERLLKALKLDKKGTWA